MAIRPAMQRPRRRQGAATGGFQMETNTHRRRPRKPLDNIAIVGLVTVRWKGIPLRDHFGIAPDVPCEPGEGRNGLGHRGEGQRVRGEAERTVLDFQEPGLLERRLAVDHGVVEVGHVALRLCGSRGEYSSDARHAHHESEIWAGFTPYNLSV
jgi:hypothetical protein